MARPTKRGTVHKPLRPAKLPKAPKPAPGRRPNAPTHPPPVKE
jgi:hypothetical protein